MSLPQLTLIHPNLPTEAATADPSLSAHCQIAREDGVSQSLVQLDALRRRHGPLLLGVIGQVLDVLRLRAMGAQRGEMLAQLVSG